MTSPLWSVDPCTFRDQHPHKHRCEIGEATYFTPFRQRCDWPRITLQSTSHKARKSECKEQTCLTTFNEVRHIRCSWERNVIVLGIDTEGPWNCSDSVMEWILVLREENRPSLLSQEFSYFHLSHIEDPLITCPNSQSYKNGQLAVQGVLSEDSFQNSYGALNRYSQIKMAAR